MAIAFSHRHRRGFAALAGSGAFGATIGLVALYRSLDAHIDGPAGWKDFSWIFASTFDDWGWVGVFAAVAATIWLGVALAVSRRWSSLSAAGILAGSALGAVALALLDRSL